MAGSNTVVIVQKRLSSYWSKFADGRGSWLDDLLTRFVTGKWLNGNKKGSLTKSQGLTLTYN